MKTSCRKSAVLQNSKTRYLTWHKSFVRRKKPRSSITSLIRRMKRMPMTPDNSGCLTSSIKSIGMISPVVVHLSSPKRNVSSRQKKSKHSHYFLGEVRRTKRLASRKKNMNYCLTTRLTSLNQTFSMVLSRRNPRCRSVKRGRRRSVIGRRNLRAIVTLRCQRRRFKSLKRP